MCRVSLLVGLLTVCGGGEVLAVSSPSLLDLNTASGDVTWTLQNKNGSVSLEADVPGGIYSDLMRGGVLDDILVGFNDVLSRWVAYDQWTYSAQFYVTVEQLSAHAAQLVFYGLDTVAYVELNEHPLGRTDNMFVRYVFPVKEHLQVGLNELKISFESPVAAAKARSDKYFVAPACVPDNYHGECHANQLRKMQASFSWDWGPAFPSVGVWKPAYIEFINLAVVRSVTSHLTKKDALWQIRLNVRLETGQTTRSYLEGYLEASVKVDSKSTKTVTEAVAVRTNDDGTTVVDLTLEVSENEVSLWWPNGFGEQPLYDVRVSFYNENYPREASTKDIQIGFRTLELVEDDAAAILGNTSAGNGLTFYFKVNGYPLFMKGSNWIPGHILPELGSNEAMIDELLEAAAETHMSMLRVWGGGVYESDYFYSRCDQLGILVWQDFLFACAMYPADADFLRSVQTELEQNVIRLQHHPSIALWAGNNENEVALRGDWYSTKSQFDRYKEEYIKLYVDTMKPIVEAIDPGRRYLVSSPSNGLESEREGYIADNPYSPQYGDTHYYNYLSDGWSMNIYPNTRFASEYGFQSFPSLATMRTATNNSEDFQLTSEYSTHRQHSPGGNAVVYYMLNMHLVLEESDPDYFDKFVFYSQISQAMIMKAETEFYRQSQADWYTMGALYWQLNDVWQAPSWAGIEFGGRWKMLHYFARHFFSPLLVSPRLLASGDIEVYIINDKFVPLENAQVTVDTFLYDSITPVDSKSYTANVGPLRAEKQAITISDLNIKHNKSIFFRFSLKSSEGNVVSPPNYVFPEPIKKINNLKVPNIQIEVVKAHSYEGERRFTVRITSDTVVLFLWLEAPGVSGRFLDNGVVVADTLTRIQFIAHSNIDAKDLKAAITYKYYIH